jgi:hypothetical protein
MIEVIKHSDEKMLLQEGSKKGWMRGGMHNKSIYEA